MIVALVVVTGLTALWFFLLRPRTGGKHAPPVVTSSPLVPIPVIGHIVEFFRSPHFMMQRCLKDHGKVFTIPVRIYGLRVFTRYMCVCVSSCPFCKDSTLLGLGFCIAGRGLSRPTESDSTVTHSPSSAPQTNVAKSVPMPHH
jgi:hypothetical protein